ncbi:uncharacterized protein F5Z01DRAFT_409824 [Emericellopsis atlantica]|uniref:AT hook domain-containing protein n=1 Tax=Emericellopsis atlantica TaxID=2614577 RepID=A0A9P8CSZ0_9HYPO|nr:uncharacterized protein F5Z01DRAFT_409824 [Emericellopsis atlantica]KAG9257685.1 hypothetical protein F5Z01DRAFT_409824 [Emericellopsis atlantica]
MAPLVIADSDDEDDLVYAPETHSSPQQSNYDDEVLSSGYVSLMGPVETSDSRNTSDRRDNTVQPGQRNVSRYSPMSTDPLHAQTSIDGNACHIQQPPRPHGTTIATPHGWGGDSLQISSSPSGVNGSTELDEGDRAKKRRKVDVLPSFADADELSLVELPGKGNFDKRTQMHASLAMPPPTLPDVQTSLMAEQARLYGNEKKSDSSGTNPATDHLSQDQGPQVAPCALIRSSGSATNINTQRSEMPFPLSFEIPFPPSMPSPAPSQHLGTEPAGTSRGTRGDLDASPEKSPKKSSSVEHCPSALAEERNSQVDPDETNTIQKPPSQVEALPLVCEDQAMLSNAAPVINDGSEDEFVEQPTRPKKQRGRPRKAAAPDVSRAGAGAGAATATNAADPPQAASGKKATKSKKKRGRPKKADRQDTEAEQAAADVPAIGEPASELNAALKPDFEHHTATEHVDGGMVAPASLDVQGTTKEAVAPRNAPVDEDTDIKDKSLLDAEVKRMTPQKQETPQEKKEAARAKPLPGPQSTGKPIYRVGLSKRSRIAPLLKIVRKE